LILLGPSETWVFYKTAAMIIPKPRGR